MNRYEAELKRLENGARIEEIARAEADVATARARCEQLEYGLARHEIRAPFNGIIGAKLTEVGAWVGVGDPIVTMAELDVVRITAQLPERYFPDVQVGTPVVLTVDALGGDALPIEARVSIKVPMADQLSRTFPIRVDVPNDGLLLAPGMMARLRLAIGRDRGEQALLLPKDALVMAPDGTRTAWVLTPAENGDGLVVMPRGVKTGREFGDKIELTGDELSVGDRVVVRGNEVLRPGQPVAVRGGAPPAR
jgi:RND family efflux transporter MFP subunit